MSDEHPNIANRDWRLHAITTLSATYTSPSTGYVHPVGTVVQKCGFVQVGSDLIDIQIANPAAMFLSLASRSAASAGELRAEILGTLEKHPSSNALAVPDSKDSQLFDCLEDAIACVIFAYTAVEAFANESIPDEFEYRRDNPGGKFIELYNKDQIERNVSLDEKLDKVLPLIFDVPSPKGTKLWEDYVRLTRIRNRLIHLKSKDLRESGPDSAAEYLWTHILAEDVKFFPQYSAMIMGHFLQKDRPRWLSRFLSGRTQRTI
jgi:hypothetical protein